MLQGKTAVITGCLQGIGRSAMDTFAKNGANVFACAYKQTEEFENHCKVLSDENGVRVTPVYFDMTNNDDIKDAAKTIMKEKLPIDILVNIAGITRDAFFSMVTMDQLQETFQVNFFSQIIFSQYIVKLMLKNGKGSIINTSSISGIDGNEGQLAYSASKAALIAATKTMARELGKNHIRVNAIAPGVIKTPMTADLTEEVIEKQLNRSKLKRQGTPEEVADLIMFLGSDMSAHITGQVLRVDGGIR